MATIEKRETGDGISYRVKVRLKGHPTATATFDRLTDAKRWGTQTEAAIREGRYFPATITKSKTLADAIERYRNEQLPELKDFKERWRILQWWLKHYGDYALTHVTADLLAGARDELSKVIIPNKDPNKRRILSPARVNRYLTGLSPVLSACVKEWGWLDYNPMMKVRKKKESTGVVRYLSKEERASLMAVLKDEQTPSHLNVIVLLALFTGARKENILSLRWQQVDLDRKAIVLTDTKNGERQTLPIVEPALSALIEWKTKSTNASPLLFPSTNDPYQHILIDNPWRTALKRAGITNFRFHDLRHSFASELAMSGASLAEIAAGTGHKTLTMVKRYAHLSHDHTAGVIERMALRVTLEMKSNKKIKEDENA